MLQIPMQIIMAAQTTTTEIKEGSILHFDKELLMGIGAQLFNVALLTVLLILILYKPVKKFLSERQMRIKNDIESAKAMQIEAQELKEKYEQMLDNIENEREEILSKAHKKAVERSDALLFETRREAEMMYDRAIDELELERKNSMQEMKEQIIEIATLMANHFVKVSIDKEDQDKFIDEAFADWNDEE